MLVKIPPIVLKHPASYLFDGDQYDILGCILTHKGIDIPPKTKSPSDLRLLIPPFTVQLRRIYYDTPLTLDILKLDFSPRKEAVARANILLKPHNIQLELAY